MIHATQNRSIRTKTCPTLTQSNRNSTRTEGVSKLNLRGLSRTLSKKINANYIQEFNADLTENSKISLKKTGR